MQLVSQILGKVGQDPQTPKNCILFASRKSAEECKAFALDARRGDDVLKDEEVQIRLFDIDTRYYAVFFPAMKTGTVMPFWVNAGVGISSRMAEKSLKHLELLKEVTDDSPPPKVKLSPAHAQVRARIAGLLERAPVDPTRAQKISPDDVYLFQTGMAGIYKVHQYLLSQHNDSTVLFGFAFPSTILIFENYGPGCKFFGKGNAADLQELETYLETEKNEGRNIQALFTEFPSNPMVETPDLKQLRKLADKYGFILIVDDTIGSFCNVDLLGIADIILTSLTKSFSGYADVMGGSAVLNPSSPLYSSLKVLFEKSYFNDVFAGDMEVLESNSRNYLSRSATLNANALALVSYLQSEALNPLSCVTAVHYPTTNASLQNYHAFMRPSTSNFTPGYGCLFSVDFDNVPSTIAFYDSLQVHHGPHLGAHLTLAMPYVKGLYGSNLEWVKQFGLKETQIRISVGLEDTAELLGVFKAALEEANKLKVLDPEKEGML